MPIEDAARALLARAAATIEVDDSAPMTLTGLPEPRHRRWPVLAAAAAVVVAIGGGVVVAQQAGDDPAEPGLEELQPGDRGQLADETEPSPERQAAADAFVRWARGNGPAPEFADRVRQIAAGFTPRWNDEPERREHWAGCSGLGFPDCGIDPVGTIFRYDGKVVVTAGRSPCAGDQELPERFAKAEGDVVRLEQPEAAACQESRLVDLWIDDEGVIYAVQQTGGVP